jgi:hypothetical protein
MSVTSTLILVIFLVGAAPGCIGAPTNQSTAALINRAIYVAEGGETVAADYRIDETVTLRFSDGRMQLLHQEASGSGIRYVAGPDEWWEHQGEATYRRKGSVIFIGRRKQLTTH